MARTPLLKLLVTRVETSGPEHADTINMTAGKNIKLLFILFSIISYICKSALCIGLKQKATRHGHSYQIDPCCLSRSIPKVQNGLRSVLIILMTFVTLFCFLAAYADDTFGKPAWIVRNEIFFGIAFSIIGWVLGIALIVNLKEMWIQ